MKSWFKEVKCPAVKLIAVLLCVMMLTGFIRVPACAEESAEAAALTYEITQAKYPTYFYNLRFKADEDIPLYFVDGAEDFPFVDLRDWRDILNYVFDGLPGYYGYKIGSCTISV